MPSLILSIFLVELAIQVINTIGATTISDFAYAEQRTMQAEYLAARRELNSTSSQDEFAKWAKLRRKHDKLLEQLEKKKSSLDGGRRTFDSTVNVLRLVLTRGLQYFLPYWFSTRPMFWLPHGWFPGYAEWLLAFPRAPRGSVSITSWQIACTSVLVMVRDTVQALVALYAEKQAKKQAEKTKVKVGVPVKEVEVIEAKKEL